MSEITDNQFVDCVARFRSATPESERIANHENALQKIIDKLCLHEEHNHLIYVGKNYSKADLVRELRELLEKEDDTD